MTRREIFEFCAAGFAAGAAVMAAPAKEAKIAKPHQDDLKLGMATYTFREFQRHLAISMMQQVGVQYASVKDVHLPMNVTAAEAAKAKADFQKAGITIVSGGNISLQDEDPALLKQKFEYARMCGMPLMVTAPTHQTLPTVEKLAKEYDIKVAIHNHGPEDKHFPTPQSVLDAVKGMDARMGLCMDVGHSMRTGIDVVKTIADAGPRLLDMHMKDLANATDRNSQCDVGEGIMPVVAIFKQLKAMKYAGNVNLEYEINGDNPLPGVLHSFGYMRGVLAGLAG
jgi:sugar phosphate isomerase/epimerase